MAAMTDLGWELYFLTEVQNQGVSTAVLPLDPVGENLPSPLPGSNGFQNILWYSSACSCKQFILYLCPHVEFLSPVSKSPSS